MYHHFWFLDVWVGGLPVWGLCQLLLAALAPAVLLPGVIRSGASKTVISWIMLIQVRSQDFAIRWRLYTVTFAGKALPVCMCD